MQSPSSSIGNAKVAEDILEVTFEMRNDKSMAKKYIDSGIFGNTVFPQMISFLKHVPALDRDCCNCLIYDVENDILRRV